MKSPIRIISLGIVYLLCGCAAAAVGSLPADETGFITRPIIGMQTAKLPNGDVQVVSVSENAEKQGLMEGDIIKEIDNHTIMQVIDINEIVEKRNPGDHVSLKILRGRQEIQLEIELTDSSIPGEQYHIFRTLAKDRPVILIVLMGRMSNNQIRDPRGLEQWKQFIQSDLPNSFETAFLSTYQHQSKFSIIDRYKALEIVDDNTVKQTGTISDKTRLELGNTLGATHILIVEIQNSPSAWEITRHLIEVETGDILATVLEKVKH